MNFTDEQKKLLGAKLNPANVKSRSKGGASLSYIEGWHAIDEANRIFGFDGWTRETVILNVVNESERLIGKEPSTKKGWSVTYTAKVRITANGIVREGVGAGHGIDTDKGQAHESAIKEAETDAMKRALMTFGNPFGLALYDKEQTNVGVDKPELTPEQKWLANAAKQFAAFNTRAGIDAWVMANPMPVLSDKQIDYYNDLINKAQDRVAAVKAA